MHSYTKKDNKFEKIVFTLAIISYIAAPFLSSLLEKKINNTEISFILSNLGLTISSVTIFTILFFIFTKWLWKIPFISNYLNVTNISGIWKCEGTGYKYDDKSVINNFPDSYYAYRAFWILQNLNSSVINAKLEYKPIEYPQLWKEFLPCMSALDYIFNCGYDFDYVLKEVEVLNQ